MMDLGSVRARGAAAVSSGLMSRVYMWMTAGLLVTAATAYFVTNSYSVLSMIYGGGQMVFFVLMLVELGLVFFLSSRAMTLQPSTAGALFFAYAAINGLTLAPILLIYTTGSVATAFLSTAGMFGAMCAYSAVTKRDLNEWRSFLMMGVVGVLIALVVNMFVGSAKADLVISIMAVIIFAGLTAYDSFRIRAIAAEAAGHGVPETNFAIAGALTLYLDFINMFIHLLRIMGKRR